MNGRDLSEVPLLGPGGLVWTEYRQATGYRAISGLDLAIEAEVLSAPRLGAAILDFRATISIDHGSTGWFRLGVAFAKSPLHLPPGADHRQRLLSLGLLIDETALAGVETQRNGWDLSLRVDLVATAVSVEGIGLAGSHSEVWTIPGEQWVTRVLAQAQTHRYLTMITPAPNSDSSVGYRHADEELQVATEALRSGRYGDVAMAVRKGIDVLGTSKLQAAHGTDRNARTVDERFGALASSLQHLAGASAHREGENADYRWSREDAVAAIAGLVALMQWTAARPGGW